MRSKFWRLTPAVVPRFPLIIGSETGWLHFWMAASQREPRHAFAEPASVREAGRAARVVALGAPLAEISTLVCLRRGASGTRRAMAGRGDRVSCRAVSDGGVLPVEFAGHGDHMCLAFSSVAEQREVAAAFVRSGLEAHDRVWYLADGDRGRVLSFLRADGVEVEEPLANGQLAVLGAQESYLGELPFDPDRAVAMLHQAREDALAAGYHGLRVTGEMGWGARQAPGCELLEDYERRVQAVFEGSPAAALCQYDRGAFATARLDGLIGVHRQLARPPLISPDGLLRISYASGWLRLVGEVDLSNRALLTRALERVADGGDIHLDARGVEFIDLSGIQPLLETADLLAPEHRLVLEHPSRAMRRLLELLGNYEGLFELWR